MTTFTKQALERKPKKYNLKEVFKVVETFNFDRSCDIETIGPREATKHFILEGDWIKGTNNRYNVFMNDCRCAGCGLEGKYFLKERHANTDVWHLNLYGVKEDGSEVMFTKDHIVPKCKAGPDTLDNLQTMCYECNQTKGSLPQNIFMIRKQLEDGTYNILPESLKGKTIAFHPDLLTAVKSQFPSIYTRMMSACRPDMPSGWQASAYKTLSAVVSSDYHDPSGGRMVHLGWDYRGHKDHRVQTTLKAAELESLLALGNASIVGEAETEIPFFVKTPAEILSAGFDNLPSCPPPNSVPAWALAKESPQILEKSLTEVEKRGKSICTDCKYFSVANKVCSYEEVTKIDYVLGKKFIKYLDCKESNREGKCPRFYKI